MINLFQIKNCDPGAAMHTFYLVFYPVQKIGIGNSVFYFVYEKINCNSKTTVTFQANTIGAAKGEMDGSIKSAFFIFTKLLKLPPLILVNNKGNSVL